MRTIIDVETMESIIGRADAAKHEVGALANAVARTSGMSNSTVPGLSELGKSHEAVFQGVSGSSAEVLDAYALQLRWMHENLQAMKSGFVIQDSAVGKNLDRIGFGWMDLAGSSVSFPARPAADFADFPFPTPSAGGHSLQSLSLAFAMTDTSGYNHMASRWRDAASRAEEISADIRMMVQDMVAHNEGEAIDAAQATITEIGEAAKAFAANANTMAASVETLVSIHSQGQSMVDSALAELDAIEDPQERQAAHASLLDSFLASFDNMLREGVPPINNLMQLPSSGGSGGSTIALGGSKHGGKSLSDTSTPTIAGAGAGGATAGTGAASGAQFGQVNSNLDQLKGIGTQGAGTGAGVGGVAPGTVTGPQAPQAPQFGGMGTGGVGGVGSVGAPRRLPPGTLDSSTGRMNGIVTSTGAGAGTGVGTGTGTGSGTGAGNGLSAVRGGMGTGGMIAPGGFGAHGGQGGAGAGGTGTRGGLGTGGGAGVGRGVAGGGVHGGGSGGSQGGSIVRRSWSDGTIGRPPAGSPGVGSGAGAGSAGAGAGSGSGGGRPPMMGGVPMGGGRGGGEQNNQRPRPKSLNDIEREDNLRALLGPPIMWVPMAIYPPSSKKED